ncbi:beb0d3ed-30da-44a9-8fb6-50a69c5fe9b9, partial [Thermothielavioides terrestris]
MKRRERGLLWKGAAQPRNARQKEGGHSPQSGLPTPRPINARRTRPCRWKPAGLFSQVAHLTCSELPLILQILDSINSVDPNARTADLRIGQDSLIDVRKVRGARGPIPGSNFVHFDAEHQVDLVEADVCVRVLAARGRGHGEQGALRHGRNRVGCHIALRPGAKSPGARWVVLFEEVADGIPIGDCASSCQKCVGSMGRGSIASALQKLASKETLKLYRSLLVVISCRGVVVYSPP